MNWNNNSADPSNQQEEIGAEDAAAISAGMFFKKINGDGSSSYYKPSEVKLAGDGSTLELIGSYTVDHDLGVAELPANATLNLNGKSIFKSLDLYQKDAIVISGDATINCDSGENRLGALRGNINSTVTISGKLQVETYIEASKLTLAQGTSVKCQGIVGDVEMGKRSILNVSYNEWAHDKVTGIDGNVKMSRGAEQAQVSVEMRTYSGNAACGINNNKAVEVHNGQKLSVTALGSSKDMAISGDLDVEAGADVSVSAKCAVGGNLKAATGSYSGFIKGNQSSVTGGTFDVNPWGIVAKDYGVKRCKEAWPPTFTVVPEGELGTRATNLFWGTRGASKGNPSYAINFTTCDDADGSYEVSFLKEIDSVYRPVYTYYRYSDDEGAQSRSDDGYAFHQVLKELGSKDLDGKYKFSVIDYGADGVGSAAISGVYKFKAPQKTLGKATNLHWDSSKPATACFKLPEGAAGYLLTVYERLDDGSYAEVDGTGFLTLECDSGQEISYALNDDDYQGLDKDGVYKFSVHACGPNLEDCLDDLEGAMSEEMVFKVGASSGSGSGSDTPGTGDSGNPGSSSGSTDNPGTGGGSGSGGSTIVTPPSDPSEPSTPGVVEPTEPGNPATSKPSKPDEPTTPDTPAAVGPEVGTVATVSDITYKVTAASEVTVAELPADKKTVTVPAKVKVGGKSFKVTGIASSLLKDSKATTLVIKSKGLTKEGVKNALKGSKVKVVKIKVSGKKSVNKKYVKQYKEIFTKKVCGKKVAIK